MKNADEVAPAALGAASVVRRRRTRIVAISALTVCLLGALYVVFRSTAPHPNREPAQRTYRLRIENQRLVSGPTVLTAFEGDSITLIVTSNRRETLHVHEYEQHLVIDLTPGREMTSSFSAERAGRFGVHLIGVDGSHGEVAAVEILPR